jgi:hypothetical protein
VDKKVHSHGYKYVEKPVRNYTNVKSEPTTKATVAAAPPIRTTSRIERMIPPPTILPLKKPRSTSATHVPTAETIKIFSGGNVPIKTNGMSGTMPKVMKARNVANPE